MVKIVSEDDSTIFITGSIINAKFKKKDIEELLGIDLFKLNDGLEDLVKRDEKGDSIEDTLKVVVTGENKSYITSYRKILEASDMTHKLMSQSISKIDKEIFVAEEPIMTLLSAISLNSIKQLYGASTDEFSLRLEDGASKAMTSVWATQRYSSMKMFTGPLEIDEGNCSISMLAPVSRIPFNLKDSIKESDMLYPMKAPMRNKFKIGALLISAKKAFESQERIWQSIDPEDFRRFLVFYDKDGKKYCPARLTLDAFEELLISRVFNYSSLNSNRFQKILWNQQEESPKRMWPKIMHQITEEEFSYPRTIPRKSATVATIESPRQVGYIYSMEGMSHLHSKDGTIAGVRIQVENWCQTAEEAIVQSALALNSRITKQKAESVNS